MKNRGRYRVIAIDLLPDNLFSPSRIEDELNKLTEDGAEIIAACPLFADTDEPCLLVILKRGESPAPPERRTQHDNTIK